MLYLHEVLKPILNRIFDDKKYVELDPCKIEQHRSRYRFCGDSLLYFISLFVDKWVTLQKPMHGPGGPISSTAMNEPYSIYVH